MRLPAAREPDRHRDADLQDWLDQTLAKQVDYDPAKAEAILQQAGFKKSGGIYQTPDGKPLSFTIITIGGYTDWVASAQSSQEH